MRWAQRDVSTGMATTDDLQDTHNEGNKYSEANIQKKKKSGLADRGREYPVSTPTQMV